MEFTESTSTLTAYRMRLGAATAWTETAIAGNPHAFTVTKKISAGTSGTTVYVQARKATGEWGPLASKVLQPCGMPDIGVDNVRLTESDAGTTDAVFRVSLSAPHSGPVTFKAATAPATALSPADFAPLALTTYTIPAGATHRDVAIPVAGDQHHEGDETFSFKLSGVTTGVGLRDSQGTGTIVDDEPPLFAWVDDVASPEGNSGSHLQRFAVRLSAAPPAGQSVAIKYATANGTATTAGGDYTAATGTLTFDSSVGSVLFVDVPIAGDATTEASETLSLNLSGNPKGVLLADKQGVATILNDDGTHGVQKPRMYVDDLWLPEGDAGTSQAVFTLRLDQPVATPVTVKVATGNSTALAGEDYGAVPTTTVTIPAGTTTKAVPVTVNGDTVREAPEAFLIKLSSASTNVTVADTSGQANLTDEEGPYNVYVSDARSAEGQVSAPGSLTFTISLDATPTPGETVTVTYATANSTALAGSDYTAKTGSLTFTSASGLAQQVTVDLLGNDVFEPNEKVTLTAKSIVPKGGVLADTSGAGTIINDD
jgi:chitinase